MRKAKTHDGDFMDSASSEGVLIWHPAGRGSQDLGHGHRGIGLRAPCFCARRYSEDSRDPLGVVQGTGQFCMPFEGEIRLTPLVARVL